MTSYTGNIPLFSIEFAKLNTLSRLYFSIKLRLYHILLCRILSFHYAYNYYL
nr:MAG TPA: hypothetical protein [Caudoviricetes sp.]